MKKNKTVVGFTQKVTDIGPKGDKKTLIARIDTGATKGSIDKGLAKKLKLGRAVKKKVIKSASGTTKRPVKKIAIIIKNRKMNADFTIADRSHMKYKILIGQNILKRNFLIDPSVK